MSGEGDLVSDAQLPGGVSTGIQIFGIAKRPGKDEVEIG